MAHSYYDFRVATLFILGVFRQFQFGSSGFRVDDETCTNVHKRTRNPEESGLFRALHRIQLETSAVKEDGRLQVIPIAETIRVFLIA